jgi:threonine dehydratase
VPALSATAIEAAARRLSGQLVATPILGGLRLPGFAVAADLRLKAELLQPGGALYWRGIQHFLLRQFGSSRGLWIVGPPRLAVVAAIAAASHRLPAVVQVTAGMTGASELRELGCELHEVRDAAASDEAERRRRGFAALPGLDDPDVAAGIATVGLELARELPSDCAAVFAAPPWVDAIGQGWAAGGRSSPVLPAASPVPSGLGAALRAGHRLEADEEGLAVLAAALAAAGDGSRVMGAVLSS